MLAMRNGPVYLLCILAVYMLAMHTGPVCSHKNHPLNEKDNRTSVEFLHSSSSIPSSPAGRVRRRIYQASDGDNLVPAEPIPRCLTCLEQHLNSIVTIGIESDACYSRSQIGI